MTELPRRIVVSKTISGRYRPGERPVNWGKRRAGIDRVTDASGLDITLVSNGGQSTPAPGWELLLTERADLDNQSGFAWTLYGLKK